MSSIDGAGADREATSVGGFRALNPSDGLFLRAEHLSTMQSYAQSLARAAASAAGPGVVHGLGVDLGADGSSLVVRPGLAVSPDGRLLSLTRPLTLSLDDDHLTPRIVPHGFWVVEAHWAAQTSGSAPVYGSLCHDACSDGGGTIRPWSDEGVTIRLRADSLDALDGQPPSERRSWLASQYFERERAASQPWPVPGRAGQPVGPLTSRDWHDDSPAPAPSGVPLATLQKVDQDWLLDAWTARRLVDGVAAHAGWRGHLAMRPWSVFLAQLLQLEHQLAAGRSELGAGAPDPDTVVVLDVEVQERLREPVAAFLRETEGKPYGSWEIVQHLREAWEDAPPTRRKVRLARSLQGLGLVELPPAGYLTVDETQPALMEVLQEFFGSAVVLRRCSVRADQVAGAVVDAQHRDRIPLRADDQPYPQIDVLVPDQRADKRELVAGTYGWVAFARRPIACHDPEPPDPPYPAPEKTQDVPVYVGRLSFDPDADPEADPDAGRGLGSTRGDFEELLEIGVVSYPANGWAWPESQGLAEKALEVARDQGARPLVVLAWARDPVSLRLAERRAGAFESALGADLHLPTAATEAEEHALILVTRSRG